MNVNHCVNDVDCIIRQQTGLQQLRQHPGRIGEHRRRHRSPRHPLPQNPGSLAILVPLNPLS